MDQAFASFPSLGAVDASAIQHMTLDQLQASIGAEQVKLLGSMNLEEFLRTVHDLDPPTNHRPIGRHQEEGAGYNNPRVEFPVQLQYGNKSLEEVWRGIAEQAPQQLKDNLVLGSFIQNLGLQNNVRMMAEAQKAAAQREAASRQHQSSHSPREYSNESPGAAMSGAPLTPPLAAPYGTAHAANTLSLSTRRPSPAPAAAALTLGQTLNPYGSNQGGYFPRHNSPAVGALVALQPPLQQQLPASRPMYGRSQSDNSYRLHHSPHVSPQLSPQLSPHPSPQLSPQVMDHARHSPSPMPALPPQQQTMSPALTGEGRQWEEAGGEGGEKLSARQRHKMRKGRVLEMTERQKRELKRKEANRESAARSRLKRLKQIDDLEAEVAVLKQENVDLRLSLVKLTAPVVEDKYNVVVGGKSLRRLRTAPDIALGAERIALAIMGQKRLQAAAQDLNVAIASATAAAAATTAAKDLNIALASVTAASLPSSATASHTSSAAAAKSAAKSSLKRVHEDEEEEDEYGARKARRGDEDDEEEEEHGSARLTELAEAAEASSPSCGSRLSSSPTCSLD